MSVRDTYTVRLLTHRPEKHGRKLYMRITPPPGAVDARGKKSKPRDRPCCLLSEPEKAGPKLKETRDQLNAQLRAVNGARVSTGTVGEGIRAWLETKRAMPERALARSSLRLYEHAAGLFLDSSLAKKQLGDVVKSDFMGLAYELMERKKANGEPLAMSTIKQRMVVFADFWRWQTGELRGLQAWVPVGRLIHAPKTEKRPWEIEELEAYLGWWADFVPRYYPLVLMLAETGGRFGEIAKLTWKQINFDARTITLKWHNVKTKEPRVIEVEPRALAAIDRRAEAWSPYVFPSAMDPNKPVPTETLAPHRRRAMEELGLPIRELDHHSLRRAYGRRALDKEQSLAAVMHQLGHTKPKTTMGYAQGVKREIRQKMSKAVSESFAAPLSPHEFLVGPCHKSGEGKDAQSTVTTDSVAAQLASGQAFVLLPPHEPVGGDPGAFGSVQEAEYVEELVDELLQAVAGNRRARAELRWIFNHHLNDENGQAPVPLEA